MTGRRRRVSRQVEGNRRDAESALARLKMAAEQCKVTSGRATARSVRAVSPSSLECTVLPNPHRLAWFRRTTVPVRWLGVRP